MAMYVSTYPDPISKLTPCYLIDQVILGIILGACLGVGFRYLMKFCERKDLIDRQSYVAQYISLAMLTIGSCTLLGTDDLLAAFAAGTPSSVGLRHGTTLLTSYAPLPLYRFGD